MFFYISAKEPYGHLAFLLEHPPHRRAPTYTSNEMYIFAKETQIATKEPSICLSTFLQMSL